ncbi:MAG: polyprenyl synthetase family protein [Saprospiraceae bacterium]
MTPERKQLMEETRIRISEEYSRIRSLNRLNPQLEGSIFELLTRRVTKCYGVRSYFVATLYRYIQKKAEQEGLELARRPEQLFTTQLPFVAEGIITVQYLENQILDSKENTRGCAKEAQRLRDQKLLSSHYLKDFLYEYIDLHILPDDPKANRRVTRTVRRIFQYVDIGQMVQDEWGTSDWFEKGHKNELPISEEIDTFIGRDIVRTYWRTINNQHRFEEGQGQFVRNYLRRVYLTSGALFVLMAELVMDILQYEGQAKRDILNMAASIGLIGQISNDIVDFFPHGTVSKNPQDVFADIRNDVVTLPLALYLGSENAHGLDDLRLDADVALREINRHLAEAIPGLLLYKNLSACLLQAVNIAGELRTESQTYFDLDIPEGILLEDMNSVVCTKYNPTLRRLIPLLNTLSQTRGNAVQQPSKPAASTRPLSYTQPSTHHDNRPASFQTAEIPAPGVSERISTASGRQVFQHAARPLADGGGKRPVRGRYEIFIADQHRRPE